MARKVLVTGADGFIGSHLVEALVRQGFAVRAFCMYNSFNRKGWLDTVAPEVTAEVETVLGDVRDPDSVEDAVAGCDAVLHLAALIGIPYSYRAPRCYVDTNVTGTVNVLAAARRHELSRVVHTSTSEVYGTAQFVPISEDHPLNAQSPYAASKIAADQMALSFHRSFGTPVTVVRPFNTYGPRQSARAVIPAVITQIVAGARELSLGATAPTRDFNYVTDTAEGFIRALESDAAVGQVVNLGSNFEISVGDTVRLIADIMGVDVTIRTATERVRPGASEVERLWADNGRARDLLRWSPRHGGLDGFRQGLAKTVAWFSEPANRQAYSNGEYVV